jgi:hypothetical protein
VAVVPLVILAQVAWVEILPQSQPAADLVVAQVVVAVVVRSILFLNRVLAWEFSAKVPMVQAAGIGRDRALHLLEVREARHPVQTVEIMVAEAQAPLPVPMVVVVVRCVSFGDPVEHSLAH